MTDVTKQVTLGKRQFVVEIRSDPHMTTIRCAELDWFYKARGYLSPGEVEIAIEAFAAGMFIGAHRPVEAPQLKEQLADVGGVGY